MVFPIATSPSSPSHSSSSSFPSFPSSSSRSQRSLVLSFPPSFSLFEPKPKCQRIHLLPTLQSTLSLVLGWCRWEKVHDEAIVSRWREESSAHVEQPEFDFVLKVENQQPHSHVAHTPTLRSPNSNDAYQTALAALSPQPLRQHPCIADAQLTRHVLRCCFRQFRRRKDSRATYDERGCVVGVGRS